MSFQPTIKFYLNGFASLATVKMEVSKLARALGIMSIPGQLEF
jgi:hypothetical protein